MNILQIVSSSRTSGAEKHVVVLSEKLKARGHQVQVVCTPGEWLPSQLQEVGIPAHPMVMHGARCFATARRLARFVRDRQIDIIHTHLTCATYYGFLIGRMTRVPVVSSVHVRTHDVVYRYLLPRPRNCIVTVSDYLRDALLGQGVPESRVRTIYNGTDFRLEKTSEEEANDAWTPERTPGLETARQDRSETLPVRAELSLPPDAELIGLFARVEEFKGHLILVQAMRSIVAKRPRAYFVCVGPVEPEMQRALWEMAAADGLAERLRFTGVRNDVQRLMAAMDVMTLPSRYEACSMAIIEAMAMGKPVVATRAGGNPELVQHRETGLLIERTPEALAEALTEILADAERLRRMGEAARLCAETRFTANVMTEKIESLYLELLKGGNVALRPSV